ncbi:hypothetical protein [Metabacillus litoralis]|nr:hypothetical protein [Metabacillus litoralis]
MESKPSHYDGSVQADYTGSTAVNEIEELQITDEMRKNIAVNPYNVNVTE